MSKGDDAIHVEIERLKQEIVKHEEWLVARQDPECKVLVAGDVVEVKDGSKYELLGYNAENNQWRVGGEADWIDNKDIVGRVS